MSLLPQPLPELSVSLPGEEALRSKKWLLGIVGTGVVSLAGLVVLFFMFCVKTHKSYSITEALSNGRSVSLELAEFAEEYGRYPDVETAELVKNKTGTSLRLDGGTSNDFLRQLFAAKICSSETIFYSKSKGIRKPDNDIKGASALESGECGFSYVLGALPSDGKRPVLVAPLISGTTHFDRTQLDGKKAVIIWADCSVTSHSINKDGDVFVRGYKLFDPANPIWDGRPPVIAWPE